MTTAVTNNTSTNSLFGTTGSSSTANAVAEGADRFLTLLVTQMKNQDPLNPMDNAQVTTQMAQISTVSGIEKLNSTVEGLNSQFVQMQALQSASLVGRYVTLEGNSLAMAEDGKGYAAIDLASAADSVKVEVLNAAGHVVDTIDLGALSSGRQDFKWTPPSTVTDTTGLKFRVTATAGAAAVKTTLLMHDTVTAVNTGGDKLTLELARSGSTPYTSIKSFD